MYTYLQTYTLCEETIQEANSSLEDVKPPNNDISNLILYYLSVYKSIRFGCEYIIINNIVIVKLYYFKDSANGYDGTGWGVYFYIYLK